MHPQHSRFIVSSLLALACVSGIRTASAAIVPGGEFPAGHLFVVLAGKGTVLELDEKGDVVGEFGQTAGFAVPWSPAFGPAGVLAVSSRNNNKIARFDAGHDVLGAFVGTGTVDGTQGLAYGPGGRLYAVSTNNDRIVVFNPFGGIDTFWNNTANTPIDGPTALTFTADGRLLSGSFFNDLLVEFDMLGSGSGTLAATAVKPEFVALASNGSVLVSSTGTDTVRVLGGGKILLSDLDLKDPDLLAPMGVAERPDGGIAAASAVQDRVVFWKDGQAEVVWQGFPSDDPVGIAYAPFVFKAKVKGAIRSFSGNVTNVNETVRLSVFPGSATAMILFDDSTSAAALAAEFGIDPIVLHGIEQTDAKAGKKRVLHAFQRPSELDGLPTASIGLVQSQSKKKGIVTLKSAKGPLHLSHVGAVFNGSITSLAKLN